MPPELADPCAGAHRYHPGGCDDELVGVADGVADGVGARAITHVVPVCGAMGLGEGLEWASELGSCSGSPQACVGRTFLFSAPNCAVTPIHGCWGSSGNCTLNV